MNRRHIKITYLLTAPEPTRGITYNVDAVNHQAESEVPVVTGGNGVVELREGTRNFRCLLKEANKRATANFNTDFILYCKCCTCGTETVQVTPLRRTLASSP